MSVSADEIVSGIAVSSLPEACGDRQGRRIRHRVDRHQERVGRRVRRAADASVEVAVTVSVKSASLFDGGVIVRPDSCAGVSVQLPPPLSVPADSAAPAGTPVMVIDSVSEPSVSVSAEEIVSGIAVSSLPEASGDRQRRRIGHRGRPSPASVSRRRGRRAAVAVRRGRGHRQREVGIAVRRRRDRQARQLRRRQRPAAVRHCPCPPTAPRPLGTPEIVIDSVSEPSVSVSADEIDSAIAVSSSPEALATVSVGASDTGVDRHRQRVAVVEAPPPSPSVEVAVTVSVKSASQFAGGVIVRPGELAGVSVQLPSPLSVPADSTAPAGTPEMMIDSVSEPSCRSAPRR